MPPVPDFKSLSLPSQCTADICLIPIGTGSASVAKEVAAIQRLLASSGLSYTMHSAGTTIDGTWEEVFKAIGKCHTMVHDMGVVRISSDIRVGTRTDKLQFHGDKIAAVERILQLETAEGGKSGE